MFNFKSKPRHPQSSTDLVGQVAAAWAARARSKEAPRGAFVLDGAPLADADMGDAVALLPLVVWHADSLYRYAINANGLGAVFRADSEALLTMSVDLDRAHRSSAEMLCFVIEALEDARAHLPRSEAVKGAVELRTLVNRFADAFGVKPEATPNAAPSARAHA